VHLHVESCRAAALARHRRVEQDRRHTSLQRFQRCQAETLVFGQKCERTRLRVQVRQFRVGDVPMPAHLRRQLLGRDRVLKILVRVAAIVADDVE